MTTESSPSNFQAKSTNYTYPQFVIDEKSGRIEVNIIEKDSGRIVKHIPSKTLHQIVRDYGSARAGGIQNIKILKA